MVIIPARSPSRSISRPTDDLRQSSKLVVYLQKLLQEKSAESLVGCVNELYRIRFSDADQFGGPTAVQRHFQRRKTEGARYLR